MAASMNKVMTMSMRRDAEHHNLSFPSFCAYQPVTMLELVHILIF
jgi:hypothetical protein